MIVYNIANNNDDILVTAHDSINDTNSVIINHDTVHDNTISKNTIPPGSRRVLARYVCIAISLS